MDKNRELGSPKTVPYVQQDVCPVLGSTRCDWLGPRREILQHCEIEHPDKIVNNPVTLVHDIFNANEQTYLLRAFKLIFLLYAKVCVEAGKLFHAVRFLGAADDAANYHFTLDIKRNGLLLSKPGSVAPQGCLAIQEPTSLTLDINSLLSVLDGFDGTTFTVRVKRKRVCKKCKYSDINRKCYKHECFFCQQGTSCRICSERVSRGSLFAHYGSVHQDITLSSGSTWQATQTELRWCLVSGTAAGLVLCTSVLTDSRCTLRMRSPQSSGRLSEFLCEVRVTDPVTGHSRTYKPDAVYNKDYDWQVLVNKEEFPSWNSEFDVCVDIRQAE